MGCEDGILKCIECSDSEARSLPRLSGCHVRVLTMCYSVAVRALGRGVGTEWRVLERRASRRSMASARATQGGVVCGVVSETHASMMVRTNASLPPLVLLLLELLLWRLLLSSLNALRLQCGHRWVHTVNEELRLRGVIGTRDVGELPIVRNLALMQQMITTSQ